jgi:hypothetical protein
MGVNCACEIAETLPQRIMIRNIMTDMLKICFIDNPKALIDLICITMGNDCKENRVWGISEQRSQKAVL